MEEVSSCAPPPALASSMWANALTSPSVLFGLLLVWEIAKHVLWRVAGAAAVAGTRVGACAREAEQLPLPDAEVAAALAHR